MIEGGTDTLRGSTPITFAIKDLHRDPPLERAALIPRFGEGGYGAVGSLSTKRAPSAWSGSSVSDPL